MTIHIQAQEGHLNDQQDAFALFIRNDLARSFDAPTDPPREMLMLVDQICGCAQPIRT